MFIRRKDIELEQGAYSSLRIITGTDWNFTTELHFAL